jgi:hypothetical protein
MVDIVLVHTGNEFTSFLNASIKKLLKQNVKIHLIISDNLISFLENTSEIIVIPESFVSSGFYSNYVLNCSQKEFRDNFLQRASSRFILINNYAKKVGLQSFFHIENDVLLLHDLTQINDVLSNSKYSACFVIDNFGRCVPSIIWFRDSLITEKLSSFINKNNNNDDMFNLFYFYYNNTKNVTNFPILPNDHYVLRRDCIDYSNNFDMFGCVFDGAAIGQYLFGIDPRNNPNNTVGFINETTNFDPSIFSYKKYGDSLYMIHNDIKTKIANIHLHCKNMDSL